MKTELDWSAYNHYGAGDAYAQLPSQGGGFGKAAAVCIGNLQCQRDVPGVMCPSYRATLEPEHSTQHRAKVLKAALNGELGDAPFIGPELAEAMDLCVGCKGCKRECPNGTDMALLRVETLAQRWKTYGFVPLRTLLLANTPHLLAWMRRLRYLLALRDKLPGLARILQPLTGIATARSMPKVAPQTFFKQQIQTVFGPAEGRAVALLVDTYANELEPNVAQAAVDVLVAAGYRVHLILPPAGEKPLCCGRTWLSSGMIADARREAQRMVDAVWPFVEKDIPILGLEPSCLLMLRDEYYALNLGDRVAKIAKAALLLEEFLAKEHDGKRLTLSFSAAADSKVVVHGHCHQKAFGAMKAMRKVLGLVENLEVEFIESSCCGMAGGFGYEAEHYDMSMRMAELSLLPKIREQKASTYVVANGLSCRHQIRDGAQRNSVHLAYLLRQFMQV